MSLSSEELLRACAETGGEPAWEEFIRRFHPVIAGTVMRTARRFGQNSPQLIDELVQDTYLKICANHCRILREFEPRATDAAFGLMKSIAASVAHDHFRGGWAEKRGSGRSDVALDTFVENTVPASHGLQQMEREILLRQVDEYLASMPGADPTTQARDRQIFWLYYRHGMTSRAIAEIAAIGLTQKGVESVIQRLTNYVRSRMVQSKLERGLEKGNDQAKGKSSATSL